MTPQAGLWGCACALLQAASTSLCHTGSAEYAGMFGSIAEATGPTYVWLNYWQSVTSYE